MSKKTLLILGGVFIILAIAASYSWWGSYVNVGKQSSNAEFDFSVFTKETTEKIAIAKKGEEEKVISKENSAWKIAGFDASTKAIDDFFATLKELKTESLASKNTENHASFGVDDEAYTLSLTKSGQTTTFVIGNRGPSFSSFYARKKDGTNVYLVAGSISDKLSQTVSGWRDKTLVNLSKEVIQKIEIASKTEPLTITKTQDGKWQAEGGSKKAILEDSTANQLLSAFGSLEATDFLNEAESKEFANAGNKIIVSVYDSNQKPLAEILLLKKDSDYWAQVAEKQTFYKIASYKLSSIILTYDEVFKEKKQ